MGNIYQNAEGILVGLKLASFELKNFHDTGYNILTYKLRNCGRSGEGNAEIQREIRWPPGLRSFCGGTLIQRGRCDDRAKLFQQLAVMLTQVTCYRLISN